MKLIRYKRGIHQVSRRRLHAFSIMCVIVSIISISSSCTSQQRELSASDILARLRSEFSKIKDYSVTLQVNVQMEEVHIPPTEVKLFFKQPDRIHLESQSFALLPREGILMNPGKFDEKNFQATMVGVDTIQNRVTYRLELFPRTDDIMARKMSLWVDPQRWVVLQMRTISWQGQSVTLSIEHVKIQRTFWLPEKMVAEVNLKGIKGFDLFHNFLPAQAEKDTSTIEAKPGRIIIRFKDYHINEGISDEIFEKEKN